MNRPSPAKLGKQVAEFNKRVQVGDAVTVTKDLGEQFHTRTRSEAWVMGGHSAMVLVDGITGGYLLERVKPKEDCGYVGSVTPNERSG
jgi:hypothetical protein